MDTLTLVIIFGVATIAVLFLGLFSMARGGEFNRKYGNVLMRFRVAVPGDHDSHHPDRAAHRLQQVSAARTAMVKLTRIYTRGGDKGKTSLGNGKRVAKHDLRVAAYGTVDEANAAIGVARLHTKGDADRMLARIQNDLFDLGADLCRPETPPPKGPVLRIIETQVSRLEREIDGMNAKLAAAQFLHPAGRQRRRRPSPSRPHHRPAGRTGHDPAGR